MNLVDPPRATGATAEHRHSRGTAEPQAGRCHRLAIRRAKQRGQIGQADGAARRAARYDHAERTENLAHIGLGLVPDCLQVTRDVPVDFSGAKQTRAA
ncbi:hypothetical protein [Paracoccus ravus]|uniref:hypothetical protein n=1 Tax=Paracoccus ravus TaxID=2447760 RepID=UPI00106EE8AF|nr:hypothetical protein [Paracoccus ravus]